MLHTHTHTHACTKTDQVPERLAPRWCPASVPVKRSLLSCCLFICPAATRCCEGEAFLSCERKGARVRARVGGGDKCVVFGGAEEPEIMPCSVILLF